MSVAKKCDRCGEFYKTNKYRASTGRIGGAFIGGVDATGNVVDDLDEHTRDEHFDLCDDCVKEFFEFMEQKQSILDPEAQTQVGFCPVRGNNLTY